MKRAPTIAFLCVVSVCLILVSPVALSQEDEKNLSENRLAGFGGEIFLPSLTVAFIDVRLWMTPTFGAEGGLGAISIPTVATFPVFMGRGIFKFIDDNKVDFYLAAGASVVLAGGGPVFFLAEASSFLVQIGTEYSLSEGMAANAEIGLVIGGGGFRIAAAGGLHFYLGRPR